MLEKLWRQFPCVKCWQGSFSWPCMSVLLCRTQALCQLNVCSLSQPTDVSRKILTPSITLDPQFMYAQHVQKPIQVRAHQYQCNYRKASCSPAMKAYLHVSKIVNVVFRQQVHTKFIVLQCWMSLPSLQVNALS